jgi:cephalosporin hydroxylase
MKSNFCFLGTELSQNINMPLVLNSFLETVKPKTIIEIGTFKGGLSVLFQIYSISYKSKFVTYDIKDYVVNTNLFDFLKIDRKKCDVFSEQTIEEIISLIQSEGTTVVFCDGGNKIKEVNFFGNYLKIGDYILAHDYSKDDNTFKNEIQNKIWDWCEIKDSDIEEVCKTNNLQKVFLEFETVAATCRIKK